MTLEPGRDLLCFSHLRWDYVYQRPQHLLSRAARTMRVLFWEEPDWIETGAPSLAVRTAAEGVIVARPTLPWHSDRAATLRRLLDGFMADQRVERPVLWYYTPQAMEFSAHVAGHPVIYDCMDELSAFAGADPGLPGHERQLMQRADLVFTGGRSLFEAKRRQHRAVHAFPSGVDADHFRPARLRLPEPEGQRGIARPRAGFFGVVDERLDRDLLARVADLRPGIQFVIVGPVAKLDLSELPQRPNLHWVGPAAYADLPAHIAQWDVALMPFAMNAATRFISPTKTPEYLAAGRPVVSTPVPDVVAAYGEVAGVQIAADAPAFAAAIDGALMAGSTWLQAADRLLATMSWDAIWSRMHALIAAESQAVAAD